MLKIALNVVILVFLAAGQGSAQGKTAELILEKTYMGFHSPTGIAVDREGNLYVSNWSGGSVTKVDTKGNHTIFADNLGSPAGLAFDNDGNLYVADYSQNVIYRIAKNKNKIIFASGLHTPTGISFNKNGELLVANRSSNEIVKVDASGHVELVAKGMRTPVGVVEDSDGNLYVTNYGGGIIKVTAGGTASAFSDEFGRPGVGIDISGQNVIFAADNGDSCVRTLAADGTTKVVVENIGGCVAVLVHEDTLYVGSWNDGAVYAYSIETK
ncbi:hypothetical protein FACS1894204_05610 [Synergistales bacterium]|nr:hypothetical protein FACS1894204_05610 [Synergistales bacterium]